MNEKTKNLIRGVIGAAKKSLSPGTSTPPQTPEPIIVALKVADLPRPYVRSLKYKCSDCGEECWVSLGTEEALLDGSAKKVVCVDCMIRKQEASKS